MSDQQIQIKVIEALKNQYDRLVLGKENFLHEINFAEIPEQVYNSNAIENNSLDIEETKKIISGEVSLERPVRNYEKFEALNLAKVLDLMFNAFKTNTTEKISQDFILDSHKILMENIWDDIAGRFRRGKEFVRVGHHIAPPPNQIQNLITKMFESFFSSREENIIKRIAKFHLDFEHAHPFCDGNGRVGRVVINYALLQLGYPPIVIFFRQRDNYYLGFQQSEDMGKTSIMESLIFYGLKTSLEKRIMALKEKI